MYLFLLLRSNSFPGGWLVSIYLFIISYLLYVEMLFAIELKGKRPITIVKLIASRLQSRADHGADGGANDG